MREEIRKGLNPEQIQAVECNKGPLLIIADAGTGKTHSLIAKLANLVDEGIPADRIAMFTFTNKAAREMKERALKLGDYDFTGLTACTFHSFCCDVLRKYASHAGLKNGFDVLTESNIETVLRLIRTEMGEVGKKSDLPTNAAIASILSKSVNKDMDIPELVMREYPKYILVTDKLVEIYNRFNEYKRRENLVDFDDMLSLTVGLFERRPDIARMYSDKFLYIMVDEYQDTNILQMKLLNQLRGFDNRDFCVVGDEAQSIYRFRGAEIKNILNFENQFPDATVVHLNRNYRSNQEILDLANHIINGAPEGHKKNMAGLWRAGEKPVLAMFYGQREEARAIANMIERMTEIEGIKRSEIAVLTRSSFYTVSLELELNARNIPFEKYGGRKFIEGKYAQDMLALLQVSRLTDVRVFWIRALELLEGIGPVKANRIAGQCIDGGLNSLLTQTKDEKTKTALKLLYDTLTETRKEKNVAEKLNILADYYDYIREEEIERSSKDYRKDMDSLYKSSRAFKSVIKAAENYTDIGRFIDDIYLENASDDEERDAVVISTIHSAKGLEWDNVFIINCGKDWYSLPELEDCRWPEIEEFLLEEGEETRRLLYVAVTRARKKLVMTVPLYPSERAEEPQKHTPFIRPEMRGILCDLVM